MAFEVAQERTPTALGTLRVVIIDRPDSGVRIMFEIEILDQNGEYLYSKQGDLEPHLTATQITQLQTFIGGMRTKATSEVLPQA